MGVPTVVPLAEPLATDPKWTGGKGANLARLVAVDLPVPAGFCVTTAVYCEVVADPTVQARIAALADLDPADTEGIKEAGRRTREAIRAQRLPAAIRQEITAELGILGIDDAYAIRSSATAEDLPHASFAGQHDTILNVVGPNAVCGTVVECMASAFTDRAIVYRQRNGIPHEAVGCAVVVQRMVYPEASGILFTADPVSGNRTRVTIDAGYGLGESQVGGRVTADTVHADASTGEVLEYTVGEKREAVHATPGGGTETTQVSAKKRRQRVLTDAEVRGLVDIGNQAHDLFGAPMDVEWCRDDDRFLLLQARPITTLFPVPEPAPEDDALHVYYSWNHKEAMSAAMPPLVVDVWRDLLTESMRRFGLGGEREVATAGGRLYQDVTPFVRNPRLRGRYLAAMASVDEPAAVAIDAFVSERDPWPDEAGLVRTVGRNLGTATRVAPLLSRITGSALGALVLGRPDAAAARQREWYDEFAADAVTRIRREQTVEERVKTALDELTGSVFGVMGRFFPFYATFVAGAALRRLCPGHEADIDALGRGLAGDVVTDMTLALGDLADLARSLPAVARAIEAGQDRETVARTEGGAAFDAALQSFLDEYGFRGPTEIDLSRPRWREDPSQVLQTVRGALLGGETGLHRAHFADLVEEAEAAATRLEVAAAEQAGRGPRGQARAAAVRRLVAVYRGYLALREHPKYGIARLLAAVREQLVAAGETLEAADVLVDTGDVWYLHLDELQAALAGEPIAPDLRRRKALFAHHAAMHAPRVVTSEGEALGEPRIAEDDALEGTPVSRGVVEGFARVVRDPTTETLARGEILVTEFCDPGMTPLFLNAAGLVTEVGGRMTHGSLVAREYGIPAVVSVPAATARIQTGQRIRVDGTHGTVEVLDRIPTEEFPKLERVRPAFESETPESGSGPAASDTAASRTDGSASERRRED
ncbi:PEP/pyruvate-binding domain-containing protein [Haloarchaeobius amylolyticus]|uniref:PEP/pyruvate-binding domain-containing protein n=1 Tax=Haloarchaeobius amylolyticus TaxID=1198296 RepID=UPI00226F8199